MRTVLPILTLSLVLSSGPGHASAHDNIFGTWKFLRIVSVADSLMNTQLDLINEQVSQADSRFIFSEEPEVPALCDEFQDYLMDLYPSEFEFPIPPGEIRKGIMPDNSGQDMDMSWWPKDNYIYVFEIDPDAVGEPDNSGARSMVRLEFLNDNREALVELHDMLSNEATGTVLLEKVEE